VTHTAEGGRGLSAAVFLVLAVSHIYFLNVYPGFISPNAASRMFMTLAIVDHGELKIDEYVARQYIGDSAHFDGHLYSDKPPGLSIWLVPAALLVRPFLPDANNNQLLVALRLVGLTAPMLAFWALVRVHFRNLGGDDRRALAVVLAGALGTHFFIYSTQLFGHALAACFLFGVYLCVRALRTQPHPKLAAATGLLLGLSFVTDYIVLVTVTGLGLYGLWLCRRAPRSALALAGGAMLPLALLLWLNAVCYGSPFTVGFHQSSTEEFHSGYQSGLAGIQAPDLSSLLWIWFERQRGLVFMSPFLILAPLGFVRMWRNPARRPDVALWLFVLASLVLFISTTLDWRGGWSVSVRYLVPGVPFLLLGVLGALDEGAQRELRVVTFIGLAAVALVLVGASAATFPHFPLEIPDPLFQLALPFASHGLVGPSVFDLLGVHVGIEPFAVLCGLALLLLVLLLAPSTQARLRSGAGALALAALVLSAGWLSSPEPTAAQGRELIRILSFMGYGR
jgi:4-amino-4-deoxy-L-arabinose transferase-like glycosyltransferase